MNKRTIFLLLKLQRMPLSPVQGANTSVKVSLLPVQWASTTGEENERHRVRQRKKGAGSGH